MLKIGKILSAAAVIGMLFTVSAYAAEKTEKLSEETNPTSLKEMTSIGGYKGKDDQVFNRPMRLYGADNVNLENSYSGNNDIKIIFVKIDANALNEQNATDIKLSFEGAGPQRTDRNTNGATIYKAVAQMGTVVNSSYEPVGNLGDLVWNRRPKISALTEAATIAAAGDSFTVDITNEITNKTEDVTIVLMAKGNSGGSEGKYYNDRVTLKYTTPDKIEWDTDTDFGWTDNNGTKSGTLRFLAATNLTDGVNAEDVESFGFALGSTDGDLTLEFINSGINLEKDDVSFAVNTTYWFDITSIPENTEHSNIYAMPYVKTATGMYYGTPFTENEVLDWSDSRKMTIE